MASNGSIVFRLFPNIYNNLRKLLSLKQQPGHSQQMGTAGKQAVCAANHLRLSDSVPEGSVGAFDHDYVAAILIVLRQ
jgi:hypothetical protein